MADVTLKYKGATIGELSETGSKTLKTAGKYCEADILAEYVKPGGGSPWELIADQTSDAIATVVTAEIPQEYQNENVYKVMITANYNKPEYPYFGFNDYFASQYESIQTMNIDHIYRGYLVKTNRDNSSAYGLAISKSVKLSDASAAQSVSIKSYYSDAIKAGCNIKVWRLVE